MHELLNISIHIIDIFLQVFNYTDIEIDLLLLSRTLNEIYRDQLDIKKLRQKIICKFQLGIRKSLYFSVNGKKKALINMKRDIYNELHEM